MKKEFNAESLKNTMGVIITIIGDIGVISELSQKKSSVSGLVVAAVIIFIGLFFQIYVNQQHIQRWRGLSLLAKRGHIQTLRMILLRDYLKKHPDEEKQGDITVTNDFVATNIKFGFVIGKNHEGCSDITYNHKFLVKRKHKKCVKFCPWIFGDDNARPSKCNVRVDGEGKSCRALSVNASFADYPVNDGIYAIKVGTLDFAKGDKKTLELSYMRKCGYKWERDEVFVIYPQCFARECEKADFAVEYTERILSRISICLTEVVCTVGSASLKNEQILKREDVEGKTYFGVKNISINANNVYIIKISHLNDNE